MRKIHNNAGLFITALAALVLLAAGLVFYNSQTRRIQKLTFQSQSLLVDWNRLQNDTYQILLSRYTATTGETPVLIGTWRDDYRSFTANLDLLARNRQAERLPEIPSRLKSIVRVWRYTEVQLNNANHHFSEILNSGLGEKVMVNGFLHTLYKLRMDGRLSVEEILLLDDAIYALETLDEVSIEFDILFSSVINDLTLAGEQYLRRVRLFSVGLTLAILVLISLYYLLNRQYRISQLNRTRALVNDKRLLLMQVVEASSEENLEYFRTRKEELRIPLDLDKIIVPMALQIDDFREFSHLHNLREQDQILSGLTSDVSEMFSSRSLIHESFRYDDDLVVFLVNLEDEGDYDALREWVKDIHQSVLETADLSVSMSIGDTCRDPIDLDLDFSDLLRIVGYRYLSGKGSFLYQGSSYLTVYDDFHYPHDKEKLFEAVLNNLDADEALRLLDEVFEFAVHYNPQNTKRLVLRLTANLSRDIEYLEKTYHIQTTDRMTSLILGTQNLETINEVKELLADIIRDVVGQCREKKNDQHNETVRRIKAYIDKHIEDFGLSADQIAEEVRLSASYLNRMFKEHTSSSIAGYINRERLLRADRLLRTTDSTISEIAEKSGFSNQGTFFRLFKRRYGRSPRDYQKEVLLIME